MARRRSKGKSPETLKTATIFVVAEEANSDRGWKYSTKRTFAPGDGSSFLTSLPPPESFASLLPLRTLLTLNRPFFFRESPPPPLTDANLNRRRGEKFPKLSLLAAWTS